MYYMSSSSVSTLDPQLASNHTELMIAESMFEGLYTAKNGTVVLGAAKSAEKSADGLTYTFTLRDDLYWSDGSRVCAQDYVFGLQRALMPSTGAPYAYKLYSIKNAREIHEGTANVSSLGVTAPNDTTIIITLIYENSGLERVLALPVAMPCNTDFFEKCGGRYGLNSNDIMSNGVYAAKTWDESGISLSLNKHYREDCVNAGVVISYPDADDDILSLINDGALDVGEIHGEDALSASSMSICTATSLDTCYAIYINKNAASGIGNNDIVKSLGLSLNKSETLSSIPSYYNITDSIIPPALTISGKKYGDIASEYYVQQFDPSLAKDTYNSALQNLSGKKLPQTTLIYPDEPGIEEIVKSVVQTWQKNIGCYLSIKAVSRQQVVKSVSSSDYQMALVPVTSYDGTAGNLIAEFASGGLYKSVSDTGFDTILTESSLAQSDDPVSMISAAEQYLLKSGYVIPLFCGESGIAYSGDIDEGSMHAAAGGYLSLKELVKK